MEPNQLNAQRVHSIDLVRGLVMVLMAIDHVRVYSGLPPGGPDAGVFFTRWVTHFCAPAFVFLSGTSAFLYGQKLKDHAKLFRYLMTRGMMLVVLELTLIRFFWTFNLDYQKFTLAGVIWMLGWCMILLSLMVRISPRTVGVAGLAIIFFQNIFALVPGLLPETLRGAFGPWWEFIYSSGFEAPGFITILYVIVPWIGVMMAGYGIGPWLLWPASRRRRLLLITGSAATLAFVVGALVIALQNDGADVPPLLYRVLNQRKYPASALFLLMTLGPTILLLAFTEKTSGFISKALITFGRVPFFYYLMHIPLIHVSALFVQRIRDGHVTTAWYDTAPYTWLPDEFHWSLGLLYLVFIIDVVILFFACRWYERYKFAHPEKNWLKFL